MATVTPNYNWPVPTSSDLVKDGATAIEALGDSIDASLVDLKGGTTGQVLSKTSNTDMDFTWVTSDDANAIQNTIVDAKGDLITATAADTPARLAVGTNGHILTADSTAATGIKWAAPAAAASGLTLVGQGTATSGTSLIFNNVFSSTYQNYLIVGRLTGSATSMAWRLRASGTNATASDYTYQSFSSEGTSNTSARATGAPVFYGPALSSGDITTLTYHVFSPFEATQTGVEMRAQARTNTANNQFNINVGAHTLSNSYDGFEFYNTGTGTFTGSIRIYGYQNS